MFILQDAILNIAWITSFPGDLLKTQRSNTVHAGQFESIRGISVRVFSVK